MLLFTLRLPAVNHGKTHARPAVFLVVLPHDRFMNEQHFFQRQILCPPAVTQPSLDNQIKTGSKPLKMGVYSPPKKDVSANSGEKAGIIIP
jgi:hypothetical protein